LWHECSQAALYVVHGSNLLLEATFFIRVYLLGGVKKSKYYPNDVIFVVTIYCTKLSCHLFLYLLIYSMDNSPPQLRLYSCLLSSASHYTIHQISRCERRETPLLLFGCIGKDAERENSCNRKACSLHNGGRTVDKRKGMHSTNGSDELCQRACHQTTASRPRCETRRHH